MKKTILLASLLSLTSCVAPSTSSYIGPSGSSTNSTKCSQSPEACFQQASQTCSGRQYSVVESHSNAGGLLADILPGPVTWYHMTYVCGQSGGAYPTFPLTGQQYRPPAVTNCQNYGNSVSCQSY